MEGYTAGFQGLETGPSVERESRSARWGSSRAFTPTHKEKDEDERELRRACLEHVSTRRILRTAVVPVDGAEAGTPVDIKTLRREDREALLSSLAEDATENESILQRIRERADRCVSFSPAAAGILVHVVLQLHSYHKKKVFPRHMRVCPSVMRAGMSDVCSGTCHAHGF